jgi:flavorubredoxin
VPNLLIYYNTKTGNTELMAQAVEEGAKKVQGIEITLTFHAKPEDLQNADAIIIGVPTYNHNMSLDVQNALQKTAESGINLKDKAGAAFGSYGWSGEAPKQVLEILKNKFQMKILDTPILSNYRPDEETLEKCRELGRKIAEKLT